MDITRSTVPGIGVLHDCVTRSGEEFRVLVDRSGERQLFVYASPESHAVLATVVLDGDEADQLADILHSLPIPDRVADLERRIAELDVREDPMNRSAGPRWPS